MPRGLDGPVYVSTAEDVALSRISLALQGELLTSPLAALTADRRSAQWIMALESQAAGAQLREIHVSLQDTDGAGGQRIASVFVAGSNAPHRAAGVAPLTAASKAPPSPLLSPLTIAARRTVGVCDDRKARNNSCVEVAFNLQRTAYLMVFTTASLGIQDLSCESRLLRTEAGPRRFRLRVPPSQLPAATGRELSPVQQSRSPDAGLYVVATEDRTAARRLHDLLRGHPVPAAAAELTSVWSPGSPSCEKPRTSMPEFWNGQPSIWRTNPKAWCSCEVGWNPEENGLKFLTGLLAGAALILTLNGELNQGKVADLAGSMWSVLLQVTADYLFPAVDSIIADAATWEIRGSAVDYGGYSRQRRYLHPRLHPRPRPHFPP